MKAAYPWSVPGSQYGSCLATARSSSPDTRSARLSGVATAERPERCAKIIRAVIIAVDGRRNSRQ
ncbi:Uncharacterised protein [Mycobacteroides abscessus subsp. abscessus]|nr:Uncharacterised protein [Mycobacteroides abscessus subsp. abscessus]